MTELIFYLPIGGCMLMLLAWRWVERRHAELDHLLFSMRDELTQFNRSNERPGRPAAERAGANA